MERYKKGDPSSYALGMSLSVEALKGIPEKITCVYLSSKCRRNAQFSLLEELCEKHHVPMITDDRQIAKLSAKENCYAIAVFDRYEHKIGDSSHICLHSFKDPGDLGTIFRSALSFDFRNIILLGEHPDLFDPRLIRASMGAFFHLSVVSYPSLEEYRKDYPHHRIYAVSEKGKEISSISFTDQDTIVFSADGREVPDIREHVSVERNGEGPLSISSLSSIVFSNIYHSKRSR